MIELERERKTWVESEILRKAELQEKFFFFFLIFPFIPLLLKVQICLRYKQGGEVLSLNEEGFSTSFFPPFLEA